jgi:hypothetical protein
MSVSLLSPGPFFAQRKAKKEDMLEEETESLCLLLTLPFLSGTGKREMECGRQ